MQGKFTDSCIWVIAQHPVTEYLLLVLLLLKPAEQAQVGKTRELVPSEN